VAAQPDDDPRPVEPSPPARLRETQEFLAEAFRQFVPLTERDDLKGAIERIVSGNDRLSPQEQAEIYREQFWLRHRDVLYDDYPGMVRVLGDEAFDAFVQAYLRAHVPDSYTLRDLGNHVGGFAARYDGFPAEVAAMARDMARFELAFIPIFDGADCEPLSLERAQSLPPEAWSGARIVFHPLHRLVELDYPVHRVRLAVKRGEQVELPEREPVQLSMWRHRDLRVHFRENQPLEHRLLSSLKAGASLVDACDRVAGEVDEAERDTLPGKLQTWFKAWATRGWIVDVSK
jgi:hypothetical protein